MERRKVTKYDAFSSLSTVPLVVDGGNPRVARVWKEEKNCTLNYCLKIKLQSTLSLPSLCDPSRRRQSKFGPRKERERIIKVIYMFALTDCFTICSFRWVVSSVHWRVTDLSWSWLCTFASSSSLRVLNNCARNCSLSLDSRLCSARASCEIFLSLMACLKPYWMPLK